MELKFFILCFFLSPFCDIIDNTSSPKVLNDQVH